MKHLTSALPLLFFKAVSSQFITAALDATCWHAPLVTGSKILAVVRGHLYVSSFSNSRTTTSSSSSTCPRSRAMSLTVAAVVASKADEFFWIRAAIAAIMDAAVSPSLSL